MRSMRRAEEHNAAEALGCEEYRMMQVCMDRSLLKVMHDLFAKRSVSQQQQQPHHYNIFVVVVGVLPLRWMVEEVIEDVVPWIVCTIIEV